MPIDQILSEARTLPEAAWPDLAKFIAFLRFEYGIGANATTEVADRPVVRKLDCLKGGLVYMSEDFDETPSCFEDYV